VIAPSREVHGEGGLIAGRFVTSVAGCHGGGEGGRGACGGTGHQASTTTGPLVASGAVVDVLAGTVVVVVGGRVVVGGPVTTGAAMVVGIGIDVSADADRGCEPDDPCNIAAPAMPPPAMTATATASQNQMLPRPRTTLFWRAHLPDGHRSPNVWT
jgi:hypothetical protein